MEEYPLILLPQEHYKFIECDVSEHYLIRSFNLVENTPLLNELSEIDANYICIYPHNIQDLSTSLLGHFTINDNKIELTKKGKTDYQDCEPNFPGTPLIYEEDYLRNDDKWHWIIKCSNVVDIKISFVHAEEAISTVSYLKHSPMKWNFWHYAVRWHINGKDSIEINKYSTGQMQTLCKKIGAKARSIIAQHAVLDIDAHPLLADNCYQVLN